MWVHKKRKQVYIFFGVKARKNQKRNEERMFEKETNKRKGLEPNERQVLMIDIPLFSQRKKAHVLLIPLRSPLFYIRHIVKPFLRKKTTSFPHQVLTHEEHKRLTYLHDIPPLHSRILTRWSCLHNRYGALLRSHYGRKCVLTIRAAITLSSLTGLCGNSCGLRPSLKSKEVLACFLSLWNW